MREHPNDEGKRISHETIYRSLFIQTRGSAWLILLSIDSHYPLTCRVLGGEHDPKLRHLTALLGTS
jgi:hypothetical protein